MGQSIQEWINQNVLKDFFRKSRLVHSWILCPNFNINRVNCNWEIFSRYLQMLQLQIFFLCLPDFVLLFDLLYFKFLTWLWTVKYHFLKRTSRSTYPRRVVFQFFQTQSFSEYMDLYFGRFFRYFGSLIWFIYLEMHLIDLF